MLLRPPPCRVAQGGGVLGRTAQPTFLQTASWHGLLSCCADRGARLMGFEGGEGRKGVPLHPSTETPWGLGLE